jgi:hypothetical protein
MVDITLPMVRKLAASSDPASNTASMDDRDLRITAISGIDTLNKQKNGQ